MNHLFKKLSFGGAGGGKKPQAKPATLKPPIVGSFQLAASYDYLESVELLSDGPIEGLVNQNGLTLSDRSLLQGVYLNDTPVIVTNNDTVSPKESFSQNPTNIDTGKTLNQVSTSNLISAFFSSLKAQRNEAPHPSLGVNINTERVVSCITNNAFSSKYENWILDGTILNTLINKVTTITNKPKTIAQLLSSWLKAPVVNKILIGSRLYSKDLDPASLGESFVVNLNDPSFLYLETSPVSYSDNNQGNPPAYTENSYNKYIKDNTHLSKILDMYLLKRYTGLKNIIEIALRKSLTDINKKDYSKEYAKTLLDNKLGINWSNSSNLIDLLMNKLNIDKNNDMIFIIPSPPKDISRGSIPLVKEYIDPITGVKTKELRKCHVKMFDSSNQVFTNSVDGIFFHDFLVPTINANGNWEDYELTGFVILQIKGKNVESISKVEKGNKGPSGRTIYTRGPGRKTIQYLNQAFCIPEKAATRLSQASQFKLIPEDYALSSANLTSNGKDKFNYTDIFVEYKEGKEHQVPLEYFSNICIDHMYGSQLIGPFRVNGLIQRIVENKQSFNFTNADKYSLNITDIITEGSNDNRTIEKKDTSFSDWNSANTNFNESLIPITHIILNPNVSQCYITLQISQLSDTISTTIDGTTYGDANAGTNYPTTVTIEVEVGNIDNDGSQKTHSTKRFEIISLIQSPTYIDIGNPDNQKNQKDYSFIINKSISSEGVWTPFDLPLIEIKTALDKELSSPISTNLSGSSKRYIKVSKISTETNSTLVRKDVSLAKITEIIKGNLTYPFSALVATKIDSRAFGSVPTKIYDCKLKKIKVPNNYFPCNLDTGKDKRYYKNQTEFNSGDRHVYQGDWNGEFHNELVWTDNPAWIIYDILTSTRYGLGQYLDIEQIDIWELYKIGRFCDAVDDFGYFQGVPDGFGGFEPRFSCNVLFTEGEKVFDVINIISALFRGQTYYYNSEIHFVDDRPKTPIALFTNSNIKDGFFNYANYRRDEQFNTIEVTYIDRFENFQTKIEFAEDEEDIRKRGIFKKTINAIGVSSPAMAKRIAQHLLFQTIKENQSVTFSAGLESLLCRPGDLIIVEDELKSLKSNFGRILDIDSNNGYIRTNDVLNTTDYESYITVYTPTGHQTRDDLRAIVNTKRSRLDSFVLTQGGWNSTYDYLTGNYRFSGYTAGFDKLETQFPSVLEEQYALYTGRNSNFCYFSTQYTGWVLGVGNPYALDSNGRFIFDSKDFNFADVNTGYGYFYNTSTIDRRGNKFSTALNGEVTGPNSKFRNINGTELYLTGGLLPSDIELTSPSHISKFKIANFESMEYGSLLIIDKLDKNFALLPLIPEGSVYRFQRKNADDQIYKVLNIQEQNPNEYLVTASLFNTGKYNFIENYQSIQNQNSTYSHTASQVINNQTFETLKSPVMTRLITGYDDAKNLYISGNWTGYSPSDSNKCLGYNVRLKQANGYSVEEFFPIEISGASFYAPSVGNYVLSVQAKGVKTNNIKYFDSEFNSSGIFILYNDGVLKDRAYITSLSILS